MATQSIQVITGRERRRFSEAEKLRLVDAAFRPGVRVADFARREGVDVSLLYRWRRQAFGTRPRLPAFVPITVAPSDPGPMRPPSTDTTLPVAGSAGVIEVVVASAQVRITGVVDPGVVTAVITALTGRTA